MLVTKDRTGKENKDWSETLDRPLDQLAFIAVEQIESLMASDSESGLTEEEAQKRLSFVGENKQRSKTEVKGLKIFFHQFQSTVVVLLLLAALASFSYHEHLQGLGILLAVFINAVTGFYMEYKAGVSLQMLEKLSGESVRAVRQSKQISLPVASIVPGDLIVLEAGCRVPADLRLIESAGLTLDESSLTGESAPVFKSPELPENKSSLSNILYHGTLVSAGRGMAIVLKTAERSSLGKLGKLLESADAGATPLEIQLEDLGKQLGYLTVFICALVSVIGIVQRQDLFLMIETGVALAVAAIPEGLPVLATLALALAAQRMVRNRAILRQLAAVETLGCTSVICSDKTGTLTENKMTACKLVVPDMLVEVDGNGYEPKGKFTLAGKEFQPGHNEQISELLLAASLCNDARLEAVQENPAAGDTENWSAHGDPTELALLSLARKWGIDCSKQAKEKPRVAEFPFDLSVKRMSTFHKGADENKLVLYTKGSPGLMLEISSWITRAGKLMPLDDKTRANLRKMNEKLAAEGLRVLAVGKREFQSNLVCFERNQMEKDLTFLGLVGIKDPPREGVKEAIEKCKQAGIRILMLTGDQSLTAAAIAAELGILEPRSQDGKSIISGKELESASETERAGLLRNASVLARVTPELKLQIVKALQNDGHIVSMTGDGVNDAAALKQANIGVAMGLNGTDLARAASQMVITDDNFSTIVKAVEQGRIIYQNIQRAVGYLLTASLASVITVALAVVFDVGLPLSPLQLLWLNLIMHIFPGLGLVLQKGDGKVMLDPPRNPSSKLIGPEQIWQICLRSSIVSIVTLASVAHAKSIVFSTAYITSVGLTTLSLALLFQAFSWLGVRERHRSGQRVIIGKAMLACMLCAYLLLFAAIYMPGLTALLGTVSLSLSDLNYSFLYAAGSFLIVQLIEFILFKLFFKKNRNQISDHPKG